MREIGIEMEISQSSASATVKGLSKRQNPLLNSYRDKEDDRKKYVELTESGREVYNNLFDISSEGK